MGLNKITDLLIREVKNAGLQFQSIGNEKSVLIKIMSAKGHPSLLIRIKNQSELGDPPYTLVRTFQDVENLQEPHFGRARGLASKVVSWSTSCAYDLIEVWRKSLKEHVFANMNDAQLRSYKERNIAGDFDKKASPIKITPHIAGEKIPPHVAHGRANEMSDCISSLIGDGLKTRQTHALKL